MAISRTRCLGLVALALAALTIARASEEPLRLVRSAAGDGDPIRMAADTTTFWKEGAAQGSLLNGSVVIEQGTLRISCPRAVTWSTPRTPNSNSDRLQCYVEDAVIQDGNNKQQCKAGFIDLTTRIAISFKSKSSPQKADAAPQNDPLYQRAAASRQVPATVPAQPEQGLQTAFFVPDRSNETGLLQVVAPGEPVQLGPPPAGAAPAEPLPPPTPVPGGSPFLSVPGGASGFRYFTIGPRYNTPFQGAIVPLPDGRDAIVLTGGIIVTVVGVDRFGTLDLEADRVVVWTRGGTGQQVLSGLQGTSGQGMHDLEFYLSGHVEMRQQIVKRISSQPFPVPEQRTLRAAELYYNVDRNQALCFNVEYEILEPSLLQPLVVKAEQLEQLSPTYFHILNGEVSASRLPSDPGFSIQIADGTLEDRKKIQRGLLGPVINRQTGEPQTVEELWVQSRDVLFYADHTPFFYLPYLAGDARSPLGPIENVDLAYNKIFGFQVGVTLNAYTLLGIDPLPGTRWQANFDYLSKRGPTVGSEFNWNPHDLLGIPAEQHGEVRGSYIHDNALDQLGGTHVNDPANLTHPANRGYFLFDDNIWHLPYGFSAQAQIAYLSDKNYFEQYYKQEFDTAYNKETFGYVKQQQANWAWDVLVEEKFSRPWVTEASWLPRGQFNWLGQSVDLPVLDLFTFSGGVDAGYTQFRPATAPPPPVMSTDVATDTARVDLTGEVSMPLPLDKIGLGDLKVVPYGNVDFTYYSNDINGNSDGRFIGGGGVRGSLPFSRLYPDVQSDLFYLNGINHKIVLSANYYAAQSTVGHSNLPQLDRMFNDTEDESLHDIRPFETTYNPKYGGILSTSPVFDPQLYAIRQTVLSAIDTRDSVEVLQGDIRQRWQTKRGYPGQEHTVDWMVLDLSASYFPRADRDNFGSHFAFLQYDWTWNIGDRTSLVSTGWVDPETNGPSMFTIGAFLNRPDRTNFFLGYREIDKLSSKAVTGAVTYVFSPKYAMTLSSVYDFGTSTALTNSLVFTRVGTDLQVSLGVSYNAILGSFGVVFEVVPNISSRIKSRYLAGMDPRLVLQ